MFMNVVSELTLIPIGIALTVIGGGAVWLTAMHSKITENAKNLSELKSDHKKEIEELKNAVAVVARDHATVLQSLARIEEILRFLQKGKQQ